MKKILLSTVMGLFLFPSVVMAVPLEWYINYGNTSEKQNKVSDYSLIQDAWAQSWGKYYNQDVPETKEETTQERPEICNDINIDAWIYREICQ